MKKNSFVLYLDQQEVFNQLSDEDAGKLIKSIYKYETTGETDLDGLLKVIFTQIKIFLDKDKQKWEEEREKRSLAGKKGMQNRWKPTITNDNSVITNDNSVINSITKITDNVNVNVNDNILKEKYNKKEKFVKPTVEEVDAYCKERKNDIDAEAFVSFYESKGWLVGKVPMKNWKSAVITWEKARKKESQNKKKVNFDYKQHEYSNADTSKVFDNLEDVEF